MLRFSLFILVVTFCFGQEEKTRYDEYTMVRFFGLHGKDIQNFEDLNIDVWAHNLIEVPSWGDVMLHQDQLDKFLELYPNHKIVYDNVQSEIDRHEEEMRIARAQPNISIFEHFPTNDEVNTFLDETVRAHPTVAKHVYIGGSATTPNGNIITGIELGSNPNAKIYFIHCTIHAREWITTTSCCYIIEQLLSTDSQLLNQYRWVIVPVFNPDGYIYSHTTTRLWRKNRQTNSGSSCVGTDLNRNFAIGFGGSGSSGDPCSETFRGGPNPFSAPETRMESNWLISNAGKIFAYMDVHSYGGLILSPWAYSMDLPPDYPELRELMIKARAAIIGVTGETYQYGSSSNLLYISSGGSKDWTYGDPRLDIFTSFSIETLGTSFTPPISFILPRAREIWAACKALIPSN